MTSSWMNVYSCLKYARFFHKRWSPSLDTVEFLCLMPVIVPCRNYFGRELSTTQFFKWNLPMYSRFFSWTPDLLDISMFAASKLHHYIRQTIYLLAYSACQKYKNTVLKWWINVLFIKLCEVLTVKKMKERENESMNAWFMPRNEIKCYWWSLTAAAKNSKALWFRTPSFPGINHSLSHELGSQWANKQSEQCGASEWVSSASEWVNGRASGSVLSSWFLVVLDHSGRECTPWSTEPELKFS